MARVAILAVLALVVAACSPNRAVTERRETDEGRSYTLVQQRLHDPAPTIVALHGGGGSAARIRSYSDFDSLVASDGAVIVYPNAEDGNWNDGRPIDLIRDADDVGFILGIIDDLITEGVTDPARVYLTGPSNGGMMTLRLLCESPERFAAAAVVIANRPADATYLCADEPVDILFIHGSADRIMPFSGGEVAPRSEALHGTVRSALDTVAAWVQINLCTSSSRSTIADDGEFTATLEVFECSGARTEWVVIEGGGHDWPGADQGAAREALLGSSGPVSATDLIWDFFEG